MKWTLIPGEKGRTDWSFFFLPLVLVLSSCAVGPDYHRPAVETPLAFKWGESPGAEKPTTGEEGAIPTEEQTASGKRLENIRWKKALPQDAIAKGEWWKIFKDPLLDQLEAQLLVGNQQLKGIYAQVVEARSLVTQSLSNFFPHIGFYPFYSRLRFSQNQPFFFLQHPVFAPVFNTSGQQIGFTQFQTGLPIYWNEWALPLAASYEADVWGRYRRELEAAKASAQATQAAYESLLLTLHAELATDYFSIRYIDAQLAVYRYMIDVFRDNLYLVQSRYDGGLANELDLARAKTDLANLQSQYIGLENTRAQIENAIAVLLGKPASSVKIAPNPISGSVPVLPEYLPSDLLQRRPDVAQAERQMAAANADIGVALGAFFPSVNLLASVGLLSSTIELLFNGSSRFWTLGPFVSLPIFEGGQLVAGLQQAKAAYQAAVANYRQGVLVAFQEVENALAALKILEAQQEAQQRTVAFAKEQFDVSLVRFKEGLVNYIEVDTTEQVWLNAQLLNLQILGERFIATVALIRALGGGWEDYSMRPVGASTKSVSRGS
ncbi:efflux transporter outer membrane subunit [Candidatus Methylacidiphilum infernorum]|uniref:Efflux transporter outer membrane subunit n=1 Tax=Candidatus Methylacidiphilum infernorum TaxID=511746 RepID=A0ABX7PX59_9BACT|nr:efflux transporter outer membrane subunit [Candidatus Methylacidiphilum infernorum]QSR87589.1 efflux transporter outer membrane subunit [Candidatus Methylacidiphilum infernorum]